MKKQTLGLNGLLVMAIVLFATGCDADSTDNDVTEEGDVSTDNDDADDTDDAVDTPTLEIAGQYTDTWGSTHEITADAWSAVFPPDGDGNVWATTCEVTQVDETAQYLVCENELLGGFSRYDWMMVDGNLYYCEVVFGLEDEDEAASTEDADRSDLETGCNHFNWTLLIPED